MTTDAVAGSILGCAVGDALGLPYENLSRRRGVRLLGEPTRHRLLFGRGMVSDDTEHTCMVAEALCAAPHDPEAFARDLAGRLRWWLLGAPAGVGFATLRATINLWLGFGPARSGVFSAGNGPAMRAAVLGAAIDDLALLRRFVEVNTRITHTDPKALHGAFAVALAAWCARRGMHGRFFDEWRAAAGIDPADEFSGLMNPVEASIAAKEPTATFADANGCTKGVSGYVYRTVPACLHAWLSHPTDFRAAVQAVIRLGGDTDTTAAIVGGIVGAGVGRAGIPPEWVAGLWEWPRGVAWVGRLAEACAKALSSGEPIPSPRAIPLVGLARNAVFLAAVVGHVARRLLPPY